MPLYFDHLLSLNFAKLQSVIFQNYFCLLFQWCNRSLFLYQLYIWQENNASNYEQPISCAINTVDIAAKETAIKQKIPHIQKKNLSKRVVIFLINNPLENDRWVPPKKVGANCGIFVGKLWDFCGLGLGELVGPTWAKNLFLKTWLHVRQYIQ